MEEIRNKFKIRLGIFVTAGIIIFMFAIFWIGRQKHLFNSTFTLYAQFKNVSGLQVGNNVRFSGINVGSVEQINIKTDTTVQVELTIDKNTQNFIKKDSRAIIGSEGLMGDKTVIISHGSSDLPRVTEGQLIASNEPTETDEILSSIKVTAENASVITEHLAEVMKKINNGEGTLGRLLSDTTIASTLSRTITNLQSGTKGFSENMEAAKHNFLLKGYFKKKEKQEKENAEKEKQNKKK